MVWKGTRCTAWDCEWFGKVPWVRYGIVDGLERCPVYGMGFVDSSCSNQLRTGSWSDHPGIHVPSRDWYGTACLLIRITSECCLARLRGEWYLVIAWDPHGARGALCEESLALLDILPEVNLCNGM